MKRWIFWSFVSVTTFMAGLAIVWATSIFSTSVTQVREIQSLTQAPPETKPEGFSPEFRDLPTFDELFPDEPVEQNADGRLIEIFDDGIYRQDEVVAKNGESWLVLVKKPSSFSLQRSTASVKKRKTVSWPGDEPDANLVFNVSGRPIFAVRNIRGLRQGPITTLFHEGMREESESEELSDGYRRNFVLGKNDYTLRTSRGITKDGAKVAVLVLELNGFSQAIVQKYHVPSDDRDIIGSLLWAGDLDGDDKLDLYFDVFNEKGSVATELHLSSYSDQGMLVGLAAYFRTAGC